MFHSGCLSTEMEELAKHGITLPPNMQGLAEEQISDLRLHDEWEDKCSPSGGYVETKDPLTRRNGRGKDISSMIVAIPCWQSLLFFSFAGLAFMMKRRLSP